MDNECPPGNSPVSRRLCTNVRAVAGTPTPPKIVPYVSPTSRFGEGRKLSFSPSVNGCGFRGTAQEPTVLEAVFTKRCPSSCPMKNSIRTGPRNFKKLGSLNGDTRLTRNILTGSALSLNIIGPPAPGPHQRLCWPNVTCQFSKFNPT